MDGLVCVCVRAHVFQGGGFDRGRRAGEGQEENVQQQNVDELVEGLTVVEFIDTTLQSGELVNSTG